MLSRIAIARRVPRAFAAPVRMFNGRTEGTVAQSKGFNKKEKAHEDEYIHRHEQEQLAKMKAEIEKKKQELETLKKDYHELENSKKE
ncbi:hypothetical protein M413DRAFT_445148 [Hebeloma cylindrosporum]|uniref:ATPase inhibitor, mitochondrial n=1 Tax=Hebeloma cylindrosporum TaxID=76867 RepID=A0A0C2YLQ1_HEBCY|nr:hypothetical protein M413DRAFT_445148 [Hebeloma cylindrosporum h7]